MATNAVTEQDRETLREICLAVKAWKSAYAARSEEEREIPWPIERVTLSEEAKASFRELDRFYQEDYNA